MVLFQPTPRLTISTKRHNLIRHSLAKKHNFSKVNQQWFIFFVFKTQNKPKLTFLNEN